MTSTMFRRGRAWSKSAGGADADLAVLTYATVNRKRVAARIGLSKSLIDKKLEGEKRNAVTELREWIAANLEDAPRERALAPLAYLCDYFEDANAPAGTGGPSDLMREGGDVLSSCGEVCADLGAAVRSGRMTDVEREKLDRKLRHHEEQIVELRREIAAANRLWRESMTAASAGRGR